MKDKKDTQQTTKEDKQSLAHKVGDALERTGEKLTEAGAEKAGKKIYQTGNKLEHSQDDK